MNADSYLIIATIVLLVGIAALSVFQPVTEVHSENMEHNSVSEVHPHANSQAETQVVVLSNKATAEVTVE
jgi:hypothetical protein